MRGIKSPLLFVVVASSASAHTLSPEAGIMARLGHEFLALHHLPIVALLIGLAAFIGWRYSQHRQSRTRSW